VRRDEELPDKLRARLGVVGGHGRRGAGVLREILALRDADAAPTESMFETLVERVLRGAGIEMPVRQYVVIVNGRQIRIDFAWVGKRVALEPRGFGPHSGRRKFQSDIDRSNDLAATGWTIIYVTWRDLVKRPGHVLERLLEVL
jgi:very-short-patch-repair endonuclease